METVVNAVNHEPWNKGKIVGQKAPFKLKDIWAIRVRLQMEGCIRELALFNLGIDSKLRGCDLVALRVRDVCHVDQMASSDSCASAHCTEHMNAKMPYTAPPTLRPTAPASHGFAQRSFRRDDTHVRVTRTTLRPRVAEPVRGWPCSAHGAASFRVTLATP